MVFLANKTKVYHTTTNATHVIITNDVLEQGQTYVFQSRVMALCGFGEKDDAFGYYPRSGGESSFGS